MSSTTTSSAVGKRSRVGELLAIVDDVDAEADLVRQAREVEADVAGADDVELGRRLDRLDVDVHLSAADEPGLLREVVRQLVVDELRACDGRSPRGPSRTRRSRSSRRRSCRRCGRRRRRASWRRPAAASSRCVETIVTSAAGFAALERVGDGGEDFLVHPAAIIRADGCTAWARGAGPGWRAGRAGRARRAGRAGSACRQCRLTRASRADGLGSAVLRLTGRQAYCAARRSRSAPCRRGTPR